MMPVKKILELQHYQQRPPVLVIDEMTIKNTTDAGPVCGCDEKLAVVNKYLPFLPGAVNPYNRRKLEPEVDSLELFWKRLKIGVKDLIFDQPIALHQCELPEVVGLPKQPPGDQMMFLRQPKYTQPYVEDRLKKCEAAPADECPCPEK